VEAGVPELGRTLRALDEACAQAATLYPTVAKRWQSGIYVILPVFRAQIAIERGYLEPAVDEGLKAAIRARRQANLAKAAQGGAS
jgi:hypothetical protein